MKTLTFACSSVENFLSLPSEFVQHPEFQSEVVKLNPDIIKKIPYHPDVAKSLMKHHPELFVVIKTNIKDEELPEFFLIEPKIYPELSRTQQELISENLLLEGLEIDGSIFYSLPGKYKKNEEFCWLAMTNYPKAIFDCDPKFLKDEQFLLKFVNKYPEHFSDAMKKIEFTDEMALIAVQKCGYNFNFLPGFLKCNTKFIQAAIQCDGMLLGKLGYSTYKNIDGIFLDAVKSNGLALRFVPQEYRTQTVISEAVKQNADALSYCYKEINDAKFAEEIVKKNGVALRDLKKFQNDMKIVKLAIENNGRSIMFTDQKLIQENDFLIFEALKTYKKAVEYASKSFIDNLKFDNDVLEAFSKNPNAIGLLHASKYISKDKNLIMEVIKKTPLIFRYCDIKYVIDKEYQSYNMF
eukprot:gene7866-12336_t